MISDPKLEDRPEQPYVAIRTQVAMDQLGTVIPELHGEVSRWLKGKGIQLAGPPFIRYLVINMETKLDIELGARVASPVAGDGRVTAGALPAGRYATLVYTDIARGIEGNAALLDWGASQGLGWDAQETSEGDAFGARIESFLTDPADEPDPAKWETEVAIRLADDDERVNPVAAVR